MTQLPLDEFYRVCHNEEYQKEFPISREMYPSLAACIKALLSPDDSKSFSIALIKKLNNYKLYNLIKAIYFIKILLQRMPKESQSLWRDWLKTHSKIKAKEEDQLTFFYADANHLLHPCHDITATKLGLLKGLERSKIKQFNYN